MIEYLDSEYELVAQCRELLAPGGLALISFANRAAPVRMMERWVRGPVERMRRRRSIARGLDTAALPRMRQHHEREARNAFAEAGLDVLDVSYYGMLTAMYKWWPVPRRPRLLNNLFLMVGVAPDPCSFSAVR